MGRDKSRLRLGDRTLLAHVRAAAQSLDPRVRVLRVDVVPRCGPLGGVVTALVSTRADAVLFLSCDMPFVTPKTLRRLIAKAGRSAEAVFVESKGTVGFPFLIRRSAYPSVRKQLALRDLTLQGLARSLKSERLRQPAKSWEHFNINTVEDLQRARGFWLRKIRRANGSSGAKGMTGVNAAPS